MSNVALYLNPEAFDTGQSTLMGRQSAGESFLRGYLRHSQAPAFYFWNVANRSVTDLKDLVSKVAPIDRPAHWIERSDRRSLAKVGNVHLPSPQIAREAWGRNTVGLGHGFGVSGITHTTASSDIMDCLADMLTAPTHPWDSLICTSNAVRDSVMVELDAVRLDLAERLGATRLPKPHVEMIPLGINTDDFVTTSEDRARWRRELEIDPEAIVVLYVGRFNHHAKMNPVPMAMALERAAKITGKKIAWVMTGWGGSDSFNELFHGDTKAYCPSIDYKVVDGRKPENRFSIWSVGDIFISLSDNIQETFGLTPVEAMAAGIPCVVSDWDGYRDTIRHEVDGFRVRTIAPRPGMGNDLAYKYANKWISYDHYVGGASQVTAVDVEEAGQAVARLIENPDLRRRMGEAAKEQARTLDWSAIIPRYEALWAEMTARRAAAPKVQVLTSNLTANPRRLDPFELFKGYATQWASTSMRVKLSADQAEAKVLDLVKRSVPTYGAFALPTKDEFLAVLKDLQHGDWVSAEKLAAPFPPARRVLIERGLLWLMKYDVVLIDRPK